MKKLLALALLSLSLSAFSDVGIYGGAQWLKVSADSGSDTANLTTPTLGAFYVLGSGFGDARLFAEVNSGSYDVSGAPSGTLTTVGLSFSPPVLPLRVRLGHTSASNNYPSGMSMGFDYAFSIAGIGAYAGLRTVNSPTSLGLAAGVEYTFK